MASDNFERSSWVATATATNGTATATKAAAAGQSHYVTLLVATFSAVVAAATTLTLSDGTWTITIEIPAGVAGVPNVPIVIPFDDLKAQTGAAVTATLGAGGTGVIGAVNLTGYTAA